MKLKLVLVALIAMMSVTSASAASKSSWIPYPEWVKKNKK